uniref:Uncharacterized protein n=1 Tax=viral metagenome TaxID=1070528 RepID=A0A6H1ZQ68_9ZZZZ
MADHEDYLPGEAPALHGPTHELDGDDEISVDGLAGVTAELAAHALLPTVHQDAPALILTHKGDAGAHHAKYTDAEARATLSPISVNPAVMVPGIDTYDYIASEIQLKHRTSLTEQYFLALVQFPNGVTITKLTLYGVRLDAAAIMRLTLLRVSWAGAEVNMAFVTANWTTGASSGSDSTINSPIVDTDNYTYCLILTLDPNDSVEDVRFTGAKIDFTG